MSPGLDVTSLLERMQAGDREAVDLLAPAVYEDLRKLAQQHLNRERADHTLQATALVHETYMRLIGQREVVWKNRAHFLAVAAQGIRRLLVDHARAKASMKRGGGRRRISIDAGLVYDETEPTDLLALHDCLEKLADAHPEKARVVEMRFFGGLTTREIAEVMAVTERTVERHWSFARAWLFREMTAGA